MEKGTLDVLTSGGMLEGWAFDENRPFDPLLVSVLDGTGNAVAAGVANLYRQDLASAGLAHGWCHFRLRAERPVSSLRSEPLRLVAGNSGKVLHSISTVAYVETRSAVIETIRELVEDDPTVLISLKQFELCESLFEDFIRARGVDAFVRAAYVYILGRAIDPEGLVIYSRLIRQKRLTPYAMLTTLADSAEFRSRPRSLVTPNAPGFPFRVDK